MGVFGRYIKSRTSTENPSLKLLSFSTPRFFQIFRVKYSAMRSQSINLLAIASLYSLVTAHPHSSEHSSIKPRITASRKFDAGDMYANWPSYDQLPLDASYPTKAAWGVWVSSPTDISIGMILKASRARMMSKEH